MCRSRRELSNEYLLAKIGVDTAENEPLEVWGENSIQYLLHSLMLISLSSYTVPRPAPQRFAGRTCGVAQMSSIRTWKADRGARSAGSHSDSQESTVLQEPPAVRQTCQWSPNCCRNKPLRALASDKTVAQR